MTTEQEFLGAYAEGWTKGDVDKILDACAPNFRFGDPNQGAIGLAAFRDYFAGFKKQVGEAEGTFMDLTGIAAYEVGDKLIACCTWRTGTRKDVVGNGLIVVGPNGVEREDVVLLEA